jgi:hypothetical protein
MNSNRFRIALGMMLFLAAVVGAIAGCNVTITPSNGFTAETPPIGAPAPVTPGEPADARAQPVQPAADPGAPPPAAPDPALVQLVSPIALYPDPILADVLPASTYPGEVQEAGQFLQSNPQPTDAQIDQQAWDPSVKAIVHYPPAVKVMYADPQWTASLGTAVNTDQPRVMLAIQDLRAQAVNAGNLKDTPQVAVVEQPPQPTVLLAAPPPPVIAIEPASPAVIFVPTYDPVVVYSQPVTIVYGPSYVTGVWLVDGVDWRHRAVFVGDWRGGYLYGPGGWRRDPAFHYDRSRAWAHDDRFGRAPNVPRTQWASAKALQGRRLPPSVAQRPVGSVIHAYAGKSGTALNTQQQQQQQQQKMNQAKKVETKEEKKK